MVLSTLGDAIRRPERRADYGLGGLTPSEWDDLRIHLDAVELKAGDTLDFLVDIGGTLNSDQFLWSAHVEAVALLRTVEPRGGDMAKDMQRLLNRKDDSQYGVAFVSAGEASRMVGWAKRLLGHARRAVEA